MTFTSKVFKENEFYYVHQIKTKAGSWDRVKRAVGLVIAVIAVSVIVFSIGFVYLQGGSNGPETQTQEPTLTPTQAPTMTPTTTFTPQPTDTATPTTVALKPADLVVNCNLEVGLYSSYRPKLAVSGTITNQGEETAHNIVLHIKSYFSNGTQAFTLDEQLVWEVIVSPPQKPSIDGGQTLTLPQSGLSCIYDLPDYAIGTDWTNAAAYSDCISTYQITVSWD